MPREMSRALPRATPVLVQSLTLMGVTAYRYGKSKETVKDSNTDTLIYLLHTTYILQIMFISFFLFFLF